MFQKTAWKLRRKMEKKNGHKKIKRTGKMITKENRIKKSKNILWNNGRLDEGGIKRKKKERRDLYNAYNLFAVKHLVKRFLLS